MINCQHHDKKKYVQLLSDSCPSFIRSVNYYEKIFIFHGKFDITCDICYKNKGKSLSELSLV